MINNFIVMGKVHGIILMCKARCHIQSLTRIIFMGTQMTLEVKFPDQSLDPVQILQFCSQKAFLKKMLIFCTWVTIHMWKLQGLYFGYFVCILVKGYTVGLYFHEHSICVEFPLSVAFLSDSPLNTVLISQRYSKHLVGSYSLGVHWW